MPVLQEDGTSSPTLQRLSEKVFVLRVGRRRYNREAHTLLRDGDVQMSWTGELTTDSARPIGGNLLIKIVEVTGATASGLFLGTAAMDAVSLVGEVIQTGPGKLLRDGSRGSFPCSAGDTVRFNDFDVTEVDIDGVDYVLVDTMHVMMKWKAQ